MTTKAEREVQQLLRKCIDMCSMETVPILQDYITPDTVPIIERLIESLNHCNEGDWMDFVEVNGPFVCWNNVDGKDYIFRILSDVDVALRGVKKSATFEDHLEELYKVDDHWYRHAGGGRGFYWTQELEVMSCEDSRKSDMFYKFKRYLKAHGASEDTIEKRIGELQQVYALAPENIRRAMSRVLQSWGVDNFESIDGLLDVVRELSK